MTTAFDEVAFTQQLREENRASFLRMVASVENATVASMRAQGYKRINQKERTVTFSFGTMTYSRSRWKKGGNIRIPVDEQLGLEPRARYSQELLYQITELANIMPYRKVAFVLELIKSVYITKNTVVKALDLANDLIKAKTDYETLALSEQKDGDKIQPKLLCIEGDGVWVKSQGKYIELSHFVVHTGHDGSSRRNLENKFEIIAGSKSSAKNKLLDLITKKFNITSETVVITNSDGGVGYSASFFQEFVSTWKPKKHIHFWDQFHVNKAIDNQLGTLSKELTQLAHKKIQTRDKKGMETVLDTAESLIETEERLNSFLRFKKLLLRQFNHTIKPQHKGYDDLSVGIMESQHRKVTYRMKKRGMYWSEKGAETLAETILLSDKGQLRELFFGAWRKDYEKIKELDQEEPTQYLDFNSGVAEVELNTHFPPQVKIGAGKFIGIKFR